MSLKLCYDSLWIIALKNMINIPKALSFSTPYTEEGILVVNISFIFACSKKKIYPRYFKGFVPPRIEIINQNL